jgi:hypothetical protein
MQRHGRCSDVSGRLTSRAKLNLLSLTDRGPRTERGAQEAMLHRSKLSHFTCQIARARHRLFKRLLDQIRCWEHIHESHHCSSYERFTDRHLHDGSLCRAANSSIRRRFEKLHLHERGVPGTA